MFKQLSDLGQAKLKHPDSKELEEYVDSLDIKMVISTISEKLLSPEAPQALNYLLQGFTDGTASQKKRLKLCLAIIKEIQSCELSSRSAVALITRIAEDLKKFPSPHIVTVAELCIELIRSTTPNGQTSWKDLLPKVLSEVVSHKEVEYAGTEMPGCEFKQRIIQVICSIKWNTCIATPLAAMFIEIELSEEEHQQVVNKLCGYIEKLSAAEIPPLVHQLLILCKNQHGITVFLSLRMYFNLKLHNKEKSVSVDLDSITDILDGDSKELSDCESMVLYYVEEAAKLSRGCVSDLLKFAKTCVNSPEYILDPFLLAVLLSLSTISTYEHQVMDTLRGALSRSAQEEERRQRSAWLRQTVAPQPDFNQVLVLLIQSNVCVRDKVLKGLVNFCISLLSSQSAKGKEAVAEALWKYGRHSLVFIVKRHRQTAKTVLQTLADNIITGQNVTQYTDCLVKVCSVAPLLVVDNLSILLRLLDFLGQLPASTARRVITAVLSLVRISTKLRDCFILVLRKSLFSREVETRKIAVTGFLQLLKVLKVKGLAALSQTDTFSGPSVFSQICMEVHTQGTSVNSSSNEAICLEVLGVLRRCFMQQAPVKICLYQGLYDALCRNPELCPSVLDSLLDHFTQFYHTDQSALPPLDVSKAITIQGADIVLQEPLGRLVFVMQQTTRKAREEFGEDERQRSTDTVTAILDSMVARYARCDLIHFELDEGTNFLDILPETLQLQETVRQTIGVYQALMDYTVNSWTPACDVEQGKKLISLFKANNLLVDYVKNCKPAKKDKEAGGAKKDKDKNAGLKKSPVFKLPETVMDFATVFRLLTLLLSDDAPFATDESATEVRQHRPLLRFALTTALEVIALTKAQLELNKSPAVLKPAVQLAKLLYECCLRRYNKVAQFESSAAIAGLECLYEILSLLFTHFHHISPVLAEIVGVDAEELPSQLRPLIRALQQLLVEAVADDETEEVAEAEADAEKKQLLNVVINTLTLLTLKLPPDHSNTIKLLDWLIDFAHKRSLPSVALTKSYLSLLLSLVTRCKTEASLLDSLPVQLARLFGSISDAEPEETPLPLSLVTQTTMSVALPLLCSTLVVTLDQLDWTLGRLRSHHSCVALPSLADASPKSRRDALLRQERAVVHQLSLCVNVIQSISCVAVPPGLCTEAVCRLLSRCYVTLTALVKYFTSKCTAQHPDYQHARLGKLVKLAGSHLSSQVAELIMHIEDLNKDITDKKVAQVLSQGRKQAVYIPRLVGDLENFSKAVTMLSKKCKDDSLSTNMKLTTTRDFRINTKKLQEVMQRNNEGGSDDEDVESSRAPSSQHKISTAASKENTTMSKRTQEDVAQSSAKRLRRK